MLADDKRVENSRCGGFPAHTPVERFMPTREGRLERRIASAERIHIIAEIKEPAHTVGQLNTPFIILR